MFPTAPTPPKDTEKVDSKAGAVLPLPTTDAMYSSLHDLCLKPMFFLGEQQELKQKTP